MFRCGAAFADNHLAGHWSADRAVSCGDCFRARHSLSRRGGYRLSRSGDVAHIPSPHTAFPQERTPQRKAPVPVDRFFGNVLLPADIKPRQAESDVSLFQIQGPLVAGTISTAVPKSCIIKEVYAKSMQDIA